MIRKYGLYSVWVVAMLATFGSLYLTEIQSLFPCHLCWYQKICMYPIAMIVGIAAWRGNLDIALYLLPQAILGLSFAIFQLIIQLFSIRQLFPLQFCAPGSDGQRTIDFGVEPLLLPILSILAFLFISCVLFFLYRTHKGLSRNK